MGRKKMLLNQWSRLPGVSQLLVIAILWSVSGCSEILEVDITDSMVTLLAPADSMASRRVAQTFRWQALEGARDYRLEVASPSLSDPSAFYLDTVTQTTSLRLILQAGRFEWRLRARNAGYETGSVGRTLRIDSSANLAEQDFRLTSPAKGMVVGSSTVTFRWEALPMADRYVLKVNEITSTDTTTINQFTKVLPAENRSYSWQVTALNATSKKESENSFDFNVDLSAPSAPQLQQPLDQAYLQSMPITFSWSRATEDIARDSLYLYSANQTVLAGFPKVITSTTYRLERSTINLSQGTYYWAVRSVQTNGRTSSLSEKRRFSLLY